MMPDMAEVRITPEVAEVFGPESVAQLRPLGAEARYLCWACERLGTMAEAVAIIVLRYRDGDLIRYAHAACTPSKVVPVDAGSPEGPPDPPRPDVPLCSSDDVSVTLHWESTSRGLDGHVVVTNTSGHACRLDGKPWVTPNDPDGRPMAVPGWRTEEFLVPGHEVRVQHRPEHGHADHEEDRDDQVGADSSISDCRGNAFSRKLTTARLWRASGQWSLRVEGTTGVIRPGRRSGFPPGRRASPPGRHGHR
jgi:Protein of unknown function (DUF4232)